MDALTTAVSLDPLPCYMYIYDLTDQITFFLVPRSHRLTIPTTSPLGSSNRFVSLLYMLKYFEIPFSSRDRKKFL